MAKNYDSKEICVAIVGIYFPMLANSTTIVSVRVRVLCVCVHLLETQ